MTFVEGCATVAAIGSVAMPIAVGLFQGGGFRQQVRSNTSDIAEVKRSHGKRLDGHDTILSDHAKMLAESEGWRKGFEAAQSAKKD